MKLDQESLKTLKNEYEKRGIIVIKNFFSDEEVSEYRNKFFVDSKKKLSKTYIGFDELNFSSELMKRIIDYKLVKVLKCIFTDPYLIPDFILQFSNTPSKLNKPHYDLQSYLRQGMSDALLSERLQYAKIGLYFQNSDESNPGSIWFIPGSHKYSIFKKIWKINITPLKTRLDILAKKFLKNYQIPLVAEAGDLVIFDGRLLHSSAPRNNQKEISEKKVAVYFSAAGTKENANFYMRNETLKLADEINSKNKDDCQRIGYFFGNLSKDIKDHCSDLEVNFYSLDSNFLNSIK